MSCPRFLKTGTCETITHDQEDLILSLLGVFVEEMIKTSLIYLTHNQLPTIHNWLILSAIKYQMVSPQGCGKKIKKYIQRIYTDINVDITDTTDTTNTTNTTNTTDITDHTFLSRALEQFYPIIKNNPQHDPCTEIINQILTQHLYSWSEQIPEIMISETNRTSDQCQCETCQTLRNLPAVELIPEDEFDGLIINSFHKISANIDEIEADDGDVNNDAGDVDAGDVDAGDGNDDGGEKKGM